MAIAVVSIPNGAKGGEGKGCERESADSYRNTSVRGCDNEE